MLSNLSPKEVKAAHDAHEIVLIDVREPREFGAERLHGALNFPLSTFDPAFLPGKGPIVFQCGTGKRSAMAAERFAAVHGCDTRHLAGGITAWKEEGLPIVLIDAATGAVVDQAS